MKDAYENYEEEEEDEEEYEDEDDEDDEDYEEEEDEEDECEEEYEEDDEDYEEDDAIVPENEVIDNVTEYGCCRAQAYEVEAYEVEDEEDDEEEDDDEEDDDEEEENEFGCAGCNYEWRDGYKNGWRDAMKYIATKTHKDVPDTPACSYCYIVCKTRKCGGKCGGTVRYCSTDCQKQDWAFGHKNKCGK